MNLADVEKEIIKTENKLKELIKLRNKLKKDQANLNEFGLC